jgi:hypothetical protein
MSATIDVVPEGWTALADADVFYPEDLPDDWRLTYFANAFKSVLVPSAAWASAADETLRAWRADVHPGFRFYLDRPSPLDRAQCARAAASLGPALAAFVAGEGVTDSAQDAELLVLGSGDGRRFGVAARCPMPLNGDLRAARDWLRGRVEHAQPLRLVILQRPTASQLAAWHDLLQLMGLG